MQDANIPPDANVEHFAQKPVYEATKRVLDVIMSALLLVLLSPVFLILSVAVLVEDGGPVFYCSRRVGKDGRPISVYKFRSMRRDADHLDAMLSPEELAEYRRNYKLERDPRVTRVGEFLRKSSLDELPQLLNILEGQLSFVGPRPVLQEETELYGEKRALLLSVRPGLTGYWQARGRSNISYEDGRRQAMELHYIRSRSFLLDLKILFWTVGAVLKMDGAH